MAENKLDLSKINASLAKVDEKFEEKVKVEELGVPITPTPSPTKLSNPVIPDFVFSETLFKAKLQEIKDFLKNFEGKPGYNPFTYYKDVVKPIEDQYVKGVRTKELFNSVINFTLVPPEVTARNLAKDTTKWQKPGDTVSLREAQDIPGNEQRKPEDAIAQLLGLKR